jgi:transposase
MMLPDNCKIFLVADPVDMRRSFDGLSAVIVERLGCHPMAGSLFLFRGRGGDRLKILWWDRNGLVLWYKRLEKGRFKWPSVESESIGLTTLELSLLLDGVDFTKLRRLPSFEARFSV